MHESLQWFTDSLKDEFFMICHLASDAVPLLERKQVLLKNFFASSPAVGHMSSLEYGRLRMHQKSFF